MKWNSLLVKFWFFGISAALLRPLKNMGHKKVLDEGPEALEANFCFWVAIGAILLLYTVFRHWPQKKKNEAGFKVFPSKCSLPLLLAAAILDATTFLIYMRALKYEDFSLVIPIRNLVPIFPFLWLFISGLAILMMGKKLNRKLLKSTDVLSLILVIAGVFLLTLNFEKVWLAELMTIPCLLSFITAGMFAATVFVQSYAFSKDYGGMDVITFVTIMIGVKVILYAVVIFFAGTMDICRQTFIDFYDVLLFIGIIGFFSSIAVMSVIKLATELKEKDGVQSAPLLSTIMLRGQVLPSVILGGIWFQEENLILRFIGAIVLTLGIIAVTLPEEKINFWWKKLRKKT